MQITSSLIAAQQARTQSPVPPRAPQTKAAEPEGFEALLFPAKAPAAAPAIAGAQAQPRSPAIFARPGSQIDIKV